MLRLLVVALLLANGVFWAWHHPPVAQALGLPAEAGRQPARLRQQVEPQAVSLVAADAPPAPAASAASDITPVAAAGSAPTTSAASPSAPPAVCLETGPLSNTAADTAQRELTQAGVPAGAWVDIRRDLPGRWIIYMGRFAGRETLQRKMEELERLNLTVTELRSPAVLAPGLALGEFGAQADAQARLDQLQQNRGVRTARLVQMASPGSEHQLRIERIEAPVAERLTALDGRAGRTRWQTCAR